MAISEDAIHIHQLTGKCSLENMLPKQRGGLPPLSLDAIRQQVSEGHSAVAIWQNRVMGYLGSSQTCIEGQQWFRLGPICVTSEATGYASKLMHWWLSHHARQTDLSGVCGLVVNERVLKLYRRYFKAIEQPHIDGDGNHQTVMYLPF